MYNRAEILDQNFIKSVKKSQFPQSKTSSRWTSYPKSSVLVDLFESQVISRHLDLIARILKAQNKSYYTIGSSGHEGNAVFGKFFRYTDMAFLHYRSGAFMIQRSKQMPQSTPLYDNLLSVCSSSDDPISGGRHKVLGSLPLLVPPQTSTIASHLPKAVGAALSIDRAKDLEIQSIMPTDSIVFCNFGDASSNHSSAQSAFNTAQLVSFQNIQMPIVFVCEDNNIGISVPTAENWIETNFSQRPNMLYLKTDGLNLINLIEKTEKAINFSRTRRKPVFLHMKTIRLLGHAGSDVESNYHDFSKIEENERNDPLLHSARILIDNKILSSEEILKLYESIRCRIKYVAQETSSRPKLKTSQEVKASIKACVNKKKSPNFPHEKTREKYFNQEYKKLSKPAHMAKLINWALTDIMLQYDNSILFGEDVAKKGGVYHVTDELYKRFGSKRVFNSPLDETSIMGTAIGLAHNGFLPIPEIQFLSYIHNAEDQIRGEASSLSFFSNGQFTNPMLLRIAGLGYQKGFGGHFHNDNSIAVFRDIPGLIIAIPSNGENAVKILRTCIKEAYENGRVCIFIEPIARYMTKDLNNENDKLWSHSYPPLEENIKLGEVSILGDLDAQHLIITYGNGTYYSSQAASDLRLKHKLKIKIIDLLWIAPLDVKDLIQNIPTNAKILIVDECRKTGSLSEALVAALIENLGSSVKIKVLAAEDCFIPLGPAAVSGMPSKKTIIKSILEWK